MVEIGRKTALIVVDMQKDFLPGGNLAVPEGDKIIPVINEYIKKFEQAGSLIVATRDWHPQNHISFKERGGPWPQHCVQNTDGAKFHEDLKFPESIIIISKADEPDKEAYSGFQGTELYSMLKEKKIDTVFVCGLATDYCVKNTVLDALKLGFKTCVLSDAIKGVDVNPGDSEKAIEEMKLEGAEIISINDIAPIHKTIESVIESIETIAEKPRRKIQKGIKKAKREVKKVLKRYEKEAKRTGKQIKAELSKTVQKIADIIKETSEKLKAKKKIKKKAKKALGKAEKKGRKISQRRGALPGKKRKGKGGGKPMATKKAAAGKKKTTKKKK